MMLSPDNRSLYTEALSPPAGFVLDTAVAATFSMDLMTLLSVPLQLVLQSTEDCDALMKDPVTLYEALQRATRRVHVFAQQGRIQAPRQHHSLYGLLEPMIIEVAAPGGGVFHPKMWLLKFVATGGDGTAYRLMLPSKNLTADRAWDAALILDGYPDNKEHKNGVELAEFVERLPGLAVNSFAPSNGFKSMLAELRQVAWELPEGFEELRFHIFGFGGRRWRPQKNRRLAVISPFIRPDALAVLATTSDKPLALVSRSESLAEIGGAAPFQSAYVLHDAAETEDGEDHQEHEVGLHAKIYVYQIGDRTHIALGSANATDAALIADKNVEILAELAGPSHLVGRVRRLFDKDAGEGLGQYLVDWSPEQNPDADTSKQDSQRALEDVRTALLAAGLHLACRQKNDGWALELAATKPVSQDGMSAVLAWPVTVGSERAVDVRLLNAVEWVTLPVESLSSLTSLVAFRLESGHETLSFALNLPVDGMPEERERAILRRVISNREGFLRYLLLLLAGMGDGADVGSVARAFSADNSPKATSAFDDVPLLEELVRAFSREPERLQKVQRLIDDIDDELNNPEGGDAGELFPAGFLSLWQVFAQAMVRHDR